MAVIKKDKYLRSIAALVQKDEMVFELQDRPVLEMDGRTFHIGSVGFDYDSGSIAYTVADGAGRTLTSEYGARPLAGLDVRVLSSLERVVSKYAALALNRERNIVNVESRARMAARRPASGPSL